MQGPRCALVDGEWVKTGGNQSASSDTGSEQVGEMYESDEHDHVSAKEQHFQSGKDEEGIDFSKHIDLLKRGLDRGVTSLAAPASEARTTNTQWAPATDSNEGGYEKEFQNEKEGNEPGAVRRKSNWSLDPSNNEVSPYAASPRRKKSLTRVSQNRYQLQITELTLKLLVLIRFIHGKTEQASATFLESS